MIRLLSLAVAFLAVIAVWRRQATPSTATSSAAWIGRLLRKVRSGDARSASNDPRLRDLPRFNLESAGFADGGQMQAAYVGAHGEQPPLSWSGEPPATAEFALIVEDVDVPFPSPLVHAIAYGIDAARHSLAAGAIPPPGQPDRRDRSIALGRGIGGQVFLPPTPIAGHGPHHYVFALFALREPLVFDHPPNKKQLMHRLGDLAIARASITGTHENP